MVRNDGCAFGRESRQMIVDIKENIKEIKFGIDGIKKQNEEMFNHQSSRLPMWTTSLITILSSLVVGLSVYFLTRGG